MKKDFLIITPDTVGVQFTFSWVDVSTPFTFERSE